MHVLEDDYFAVKQTSSVIEGRIWTFMLINRVWIETWPSPFLKLYFEIAFVWLLHSNCDQEYQAFKIDLIFKLANEIGSRVLLHHFLFSSFLVALKG